MFKIILYTLTIHFIATHFKYNFVETTIQRTIFIMNVHFIFNIHLYIYIYIYMFAQPPVE